MSPRLGEFKYGVGVKIHIPMCRNDYERLVHDNRNTLYLLRELICNL